MGSVPVPAGESVYWRPLLRREELTTRGAVRHVRTPPARGSGGTFSLAVGACASRFETTFQQIEALDPDVLVWEGDINYLDAMGAVAQTMSGYAGLWKALLRTPELEGLFSSSCVAFWRDDHDYGHNDVASQELRACGVDPFESVLEVRAAPLEMPEPAWHGIKSGDSVVFADDGNFFCYLEAAGTGADATLDVSLRYGDGEIAWETQLSASG